MYFSTFLSGCRNALFLLSLILLLTLNAQAQSENYNWSNVSIGGGGFVSAIIPSRSQANLMYARTDVGGAYRWNASDNSWIPLLDWVSDSELSYLGVESIALDPNAPNKLYMLVGTSYFNNGKTAVLRSDDYGNSFTITDVSSQFKAHGNGMGRQNGERLQVDPANGSILYCGTRWNGLFRSSDSGATWTRLTSLNITTTPNENGIPIVTLDPNSVSNGQTQRIFVGVSRTGTNFYRSDNAGQSFTAVSGGPTDLMPQRAIVSGGFVYITYANGAGPHGHWAVPEPFDVGQIWKYNISTGAWTNITPSGFTRPFGGISADPNNPSRIIASTINTWMLQENAYGDRFLVSTNGGSSWTDVVARGFDLDPNGVTWVDTQSIHWCGSIEFDPFNTQRVIVTSGNGVFMNDNIDATVGVWKFNVKGLEETVPMGLESIPGGPAISVVLDYDGFRHTDVSAYAPIHTPRMGSTTGLAVAAQNTNKIVRVGTSMYYSTNMGQSWTQCTINGEKGDVAVSSDGNTFIHCPSGSSTMYRSTNNGSSWTTVTGIAVADARPVADPVNASKFYVYDPGTGRLYVSTNGGASFAVSGTTSSGGSEIIRAVPGKEGELWIPLYNNGLAKSTNSGQSFTVISGVTNCEAIGFGKAASGSTSPAVYMWGTVNNVRGIHRSIDQGATWVRVNDDAHEYGGPANGKFVQGDMNVYGRVYMSTAGRGIVYGDPGVTNSLTVSPTSLTFSATGGSQSVTVTSNVSWTASASATWLSVSPGSGTNNGTVTITAASNSGAARSGSVTITGGGITRTISVSQASAGGSSSIVVRARGTSGGEIIELRMNNTVVATWTLSKSYADFSASGTGTPSVHFTNDGRRRDVQVDYLVIDGTTYQAEAQAENTGVFVNGACGGSFSEYLNCNGYINFTTSSSAASMGDAVVVNETVMEQMISVTLYPNPAEQTLTVKINNITEKTRINLLTSTGSLITTEKPESNEHQLDLSKLQSGLYFISVTGNHKRETLKIFKK